MGIRIGILGALAVFVCGAVNAQPFRLGMTLSTDFIATLVRRDLSSSQVAIINGSVGTAMVFDREVSTGPIAFLGGSGNFVWAQIAQQLSGAVANDKPLHLKIERWSINSQSCANAAAGIEEFLARLADVRAGRALASPKDIVVVDATALQIITVENDVWVSFEPNGALNPPLQQAAERLHSAVSRCAGSISPTVEEHDF